MEKQAFDAGAVSSALAGLDGSVVVLVDGRKIVDVARSRNDAGDLQVHFVLADAVPVPAPAPAVAEPAPPVVIPVRDPVFDGALVGTIAEALGDEPTASAIDEVAAAETGEADAADVLDDALKSADGPAF